MLKSALASALLIGALATGAAAEPAPLAPQEPVRLDDQQLDRVVAGEVNGGIQGAVGWFTGTVGSLTRVLPGQILAFLLQPPDPI